CVERRAAFAEHAARRVTEQRGLVRGDRRIAFRALVGRGSETERGDDAPGAAKGHLTRVARRLRGERVEGVGDRVEEIGVGPLASEVQRNLRDRLRTAEPLEIAREIGSRAYVLESGEHIELAAGLRVQKRR